MHFFSKSALALTALAALGLAAARPAAAQIQTFDLTYSAVDFGDTAIANATITLDESKITNPGRTDQNLSPFVTDFSITVSGAISGNGTFGFSDYNGSSAEGGFELDTFGGTLDFTKQLVGQPTAYAPFGTRLDGSSGDFGLYLNSAGAIAGAPTHVNPFTIYASSGESLRLTSFAPAPVPEPSSLATFGFGALGLGGLMFAAKRKKQSA